jgi:hypothetical protein
VRGETSLSNASHFAPMAYSKVANPVMLPPGRATKPADRIAGRRKDDRYGTRRLLERTHSCAPGSDQNIGREHYQFRRVPPNFIDITSSPTIFEL